MYMRIVIIKLTYQTKLVYSLYAAFIYSIVRIFLNFIYSLKNIIFGKSNFMNTEEKRKTLLKLILETD